MRKNFVGRVSDLIQPTPDLFDASYGFGIKNNRDTVEGKCWIFYDLSQSMKAEIFVFILGAGIEYPGLAARF